MKLFKIFFISVLLTLMNSNVYPETKRDCSMFNNNSLMGSYDKWRCEKGKEPRKKLNLGEKLKKLNPLSKN